MLREVDIDEISDGKRYKKDDYVKIACDDCKGCSDCCRTVGETIVLDPFDIYNLSKALKKTFVEMMEKEIEIRMIDKVILPNIMMQEKTGACGMLSQEGRCLIHNFRPGFCRLFPLGRVYNEDGDFDYFIQVHECAYPNKSDVLVKDWMGYENMDEYESFIRSWHAVTKRISEYVNTLDEEEAIKKANWILIRVFFERPYDINKDFFEQYYQRLHSLM